MSSVALVEVLRKLCPWHPQAFTINARRAAHSRAQLLAPSYGSAKRMEAMPAQSALRKRPASAAASGPASAAKHKAPRLSSNAEANLQIHAKDDHMIKIIKSFLQKLGSAKVATICKNADSMVELPTSSGCTGSNITQYVSHALFQVLGVGGVREVFACENVAPSL